MIIKPCRKLDNGKVVLDDPPTDEEIRILLDDLNDIVPMLRPGLPSEPLRLRINEIVMGSPGRRKVLNLWYYHCIDQNKADPKIHWLKVALAVLIGHLNGRVKPGHDAADYLQEAIERINPGNTMKPGAALDDTEHEILKSLMKAGNRLVKKGDLAADISRDRHTVRVAVKRLERMGLIKTPKGPNSGLELTPNGRGMLPIE